MCPHFLMELHVSLAAAVPNGRVEYIPQLDSITTEGMIDNGQAVPSAEPGLGIAWDWEAIGKRRTGDTTLVVK